MSREVFATLLAALALVSQAQVAHASCETDYEVARKAAYACMRACRDISTAAAVAKAPADSPVKKVNDLSKLTLVEERALTAKQNEWCVWNVGACGNERGALIHAAESCLAVKTEATQCARAAFKLTSTMNKRAYYLHAQAMARRALATAVAATAETKKELKTNESAVSQCMYNAEHPKASGGKYTPLCLGDSKPASDNPGSFAQMNDDLHSDGSRCARYNKQEAACTKAAAAARAELEGKLKVADASSAMHEEVVARMTDFVKVLDTTSAERKRDVEKLNCGSPW